MLSQSTALLTLPIRHYTHQFSLKSGWGVSNTRYFRGYDRILIQRALTSNADDDGKEIHQDRRRQTALLWLSTNRLRVRDNIALTRAAELGHDGLTICVAWPYAYYDVSSSTSIHELTPVQAFGYAALHALNCSLDELGQKVNLIPIIGGNDDDMISTLANIVQELKPTNVVVDVSLLDKHCNHASLLRDRIQSPKEKNDGSTTSNVIEVVDDGLIIPFDKVHKVLGRSRMGGRALRWSTFLSNTQTMHREEDNKPTWDISELPPPMSDDIISASVPIPLIETFPSWAQQLLTDWGAIIEDEAILRSSAKQRSSSAKLDQSSSSSLTEKGSIDTKLSPYLRWGMVSPQRAAKGGVRKRDLLWRDWSYICYGLLNPLRRGEAVLEFMDKSCSSNGNEEELFKLWCVGNTGSHLVDACMRHLWIEGWIPRRLRLITAACLVEGKWGAFFVFPLFFMIHKNLHLLILF